MTVLNVEESNAGYVSCIASNVAGFARAMASLAVRGRMCFNSNSVTMLGILCSFTEKRVETGVRFVDKRESITVL